MDSDAPPSFYPQPRSARSILVRAAALLLSLGVVSAVALRSGGCFASTHEVDEDLSAVKDPSVPNRPHSKGSAPPSEEEEDPAYMGGAKAPAGDWARPRKPSSQKQEPQAQPASPQKPGPK